jgi:acyl transferase domain-containing protein/NADP-dependent 3-hydroxy acid dehydrogenase YdfG
MGQVMSVSSFASYVLIPAGLPAARMLAAAGRAGAVGLVVPVAGRGLGPARAEAAEAGVAFGLAGLGAGDLAALAAERPEGLTTVVAMVPVLAAAGPAVAVLRKAGVTVLAEAIACDGAALALDVDGFVLKGHECGGLVSEQTTFVLLQQFRRQTHLPLIVRGGIVPETAAAAAAGGAAGVMLDDQIMLLAESPLRDAGQRRRIAGFSGSETLQIEDQARGLYLRGLEQPGSKAGAEVAARLRAAPDSIAELAAEFSWGAGGIAPAGQGLALAQGMAARYRTLGRLIGAIRTAVETLPEAAAARAALAEGAPLAQSLGTRYPILQGPMTRVSDVSDFFLRVAEGGALPFAALALLSGEHTLKLLEQTRDLLGDRPWGVGMLGFADTKVLKPQMEAVDRVRPNFAIIAGGRINQVLEFEGKGIPAFVHASSAGILAHYLDEGVRRFILEGRECGGHVGPMSSFALWGAVVTALRDHPVIQREGRKVQIVLAGGIHDAVSAAMAATVVEPLAAMGVQVGVLMGTGYLFTKEIVESGAIVPDYQETALDCGDTRVLWEGPGFGSRCAITPIVEEFATARADLEAGGAGVTEVKNVLEEFSLGRLRLATKGLMRTGPEKVLTEIGPEERHQKGMYMIGQIAALQDSVRSIADFHEDVSAGSVAHLRALRLPEEADVTAPPPADIAIVGMATLLPGSDTLARYWRRIVTGQSAIRTIPEDRWSEAAYFDADRSLRDHVYSRWGGFLDDVAFNPLDYGIPPTTIDAVDTMQLLALELVSDVLKDAGMETAEPAVRARTSVIFGFSGGVGEKGGQYVARSELPRLLGTVPDEVWARLPEWTEDSFAGLLPNVSAGRVANRFDLGGTNVTVDAACASSLAAVYAAVMELESGRADAVVAGGVDSLQSPFGYLCFSKTQALSPRGVCNTFDKKADGIVISEGLAAVVLKRHADALRDGDRVYAVIKGVGASSDGRAKGLTAPLPAGQKRALGRAYAQAGFSPADVELFEAHGTGTVAGDRAELETVTGALAAAGAGPKTAAIGSVKTLIGHTKASAGIAGLIKVALGLHHKVLPPHALVDDPNAVFEDGQGPLYLAQTARPWVPAPGKARRAGVSSFGFGGTNFHVALEEAGDRFAESPAADPGVDVAVLAFAAATRADLARRVAKVEATGTLQGLAAKVAGSLGAGPVRLAFTAGSLTEAGEKLARAVAFLESGAEQVPEGLHFSAAPRLLNGGRLAFLFSGQGSQYPGMLRASAMLHPAMMDVLEAAEVAAAGTPTFTGRRLSRLVWPGDAFDPATKKVQMAELTATEVAQPALGAVGAGLFATLSALGLRPDMVAGHSYGEFVALHAAGAFDLATLIRLSEARGRAMVTHGDPARPGGMAAVGGDADAVRAGLGADHPDVVIANLNSPRQTVIAGPKAAVLAASEALAAQGLQVTPVPVSQAFHSPLMAGAQADFAQALAAADWQATALPVYSNATGLPHGADPAAQRAAMAAHLVSAVDFTGMVRRMAADGATVFVEVGPKAVLAGRVPEILGPGAARVVAVDRAQGDAVTLTDALAQLFVEGAGVDLAAFAGRLADPAPRPAREGERNLWYLNGAYARRAGAPLRDVTPPVAVLAAPVSAPVSVSVPAQSGPVSLSSPAAGLPPSPATPHTEIEFMEITESDPGSGWATPMAQPSVLGEYHSMMREFLRVQESVMLAYLGSDAPRMAAPAPVYQAPVYQAPVYQVPSYQPPAFQPMVAPVAAPAPQPAPVAAPVQAAPVVAPVAAAPAPAPAVVAKVAPKELDLMGAFIAIVAEKTGYPEDTLDADQAMEADLGIDSIKRMEILGAVQKILPESAAAAMRAEMDVVAELATIRAIVDFITARMGGAAPASTGGAAADARPFDQTGEDHAEAAVLPRFIQVPFAEPAFHLTDTLPAGLRVIVTETADGFHTAVTAALEAAGAVPVLCPRAVLDAAEAGPAVEWMQAQAGVGGLVWLESRTEMPDPLTVTLADWRAAKEAGTKRFFRVLQALSPQLRTGGRIIAATATGGLFGRTLDAGRPGLSAGAGVIGIVKALSLEWRECSSKVIDLDPLEPVAAQAAHLVHEMSFLRGRREAGYPGGVRTILRTEPAALSPPRGPVAMPGPDWVILATGGARGITAECLRTLAPFRPTLVVIGRTPLPEHEGPETAGLDRAELRALYLAQAKARGEKVRPAEIEERITRLRALRDIRQNVDDFEAMGATVDFRVADVADVEAVIADVYRTHGRIDMVVHGAGLIEDALIENKSPESFDRVFDVKVDTAWRMLHALNPAGLKGVCFFTSVAGRYGNAGQVDYAAANETLNRLAWDLRRQWPHVTVKAINWGPWDRTTTGAGMVTETVRAQFLARDIGMVEAVPGRDLFFKEMFWAAPDEVESVGWVADGETMEENFCGLPPAPGAEPLGGDMVLLRRARRVPGKEALVWRFDLVNAPYVDDHRFDGVGVMPFAAMLQMMTELPRAFGETRAVAAVEDVQLYTGLTLAKGPFDVHFELEPPAADGRRRVNVRAEGDMRRLRYRADLRFAAGSDLPAGTIPSPLLAADLPGDAVWQGGPGIAAIYRGWLSHGPLFQTIDRMVDVAGDHVLCLGHATPPGRFLPVPAGLRWDVDPGVFDAVLQTIWIWTRSMQGAPSLPMGMGSLQRFAGDIAAGPLTIRMQLRTPPDDPFTISDITVHDAAGRLCYLVEAMKGQASRQLNRLAGGWQGGHVMEAAQ